MRRKKRNNAFSDTPPRLEFNKSRIKLGRSSPVYSRTTLPTPGSLEYVSSCVCVLAPRKIQGIKEGRRKLKAFVTPHPESPNRATKLLVHTLYWPTSCTPADPAFLAGKTAFAYLRGGGCNGGALTREGERRFLAKFILLACSWLRYSTSLFVQDFSPLFALYAWIIFGFRARVVSIFSLSLIVIVIASSRSWWKDNYYEEEMFLSLSLLY